MANELIVSAYYSKDGLPALGLNPTVNIWEVDNASQNQVITNAAMSEIGDGFYKYVFTVADGYNKSKTYLTRTFGGNILSDYEKYSVAKYDPIIEPTVIQDIVDGVWDADLNQFTIPGSTGKTLRTVENDVTVIKTTTNELKNKTDTIIIPLLEILLKFEKNKTKIDKVAQTLTVYDNDGVTPLQVFNLKDSTGAPSVTEVCIREPA